MSFNSWEQETLSHSQTFKLLIMFYRLLYLQPQNFLLNV